MKYYLKSLQNFSFRGSVFVTKRCQFSMILSRLNKLPFTSDMSNESHTVEYINTIAKPYTVTTYSRPNLIITHGKGSYLYDLENRKFIDFSSGIAVTCLGHADVEIADLISEQTRTLIHCSNLYYNLPAGELASKLVTKTINSGGMKDAQRVFICNSGTEANEAALKFARKYGKSINKDKIEIITFENSFHGRSMGSLSVTPNVKYQLPFMPLIPGIQVAKANNIESVKSLINKNKTCAVIIEPIQGEGGINEINQDFLISLKRLCDEYDVLLIYDEIQCGLGRTGKLWAHSYLPKDAHPDILTMAKALGNGFPIGATMITEKVEKTLNVGDHGTTYGGNPLACRVGSFVLDKISDPQFLYQVNKKSELILNGLNQIAQKFPKHIDAIKGKGLLLGLQCNESISNTSIVNKCREHGLLVMLAGLNVIRIVPALNIPDETIIEGLQILNSSIEELCN